MGYLKIPNLYKNQTILQFKTCYVLEKIHGTSAHVKYKDNTVTFFSGGAKHDQFAALFDADALAKTFREVVAEDCDVVIYGEAYGGKLQGMRHVYGPDLKFVAFDVKIGHVWLDVPKAHTFVTKFGLEFVDYKLLLTGLKYINRERDTPSVQAMRNGMGDTHIREGVVLRSPFEVRLNNGSRVIAKHKAEAFSERKHQPKVDSTQLAVLEQATAIADEWVVPMRLEHILQKLPHVTGIEHTKDVIKAMIDDVLLESKDEIVDSKAARKAIGTKAAKLWKETISRRLRDDLAPCGSISEDCVAGYKHNYPDHDCPCGEGCAWHIEEFPAKKTDKCRCETEKWVTVDGNGSRKRSDFVIDDDSSTCSNGCCEKLKCKLCGRNSWSSKPIEKLLNRFSKNTTSW